MRILIVSQRVPFPLKDGGAIALFNTIKGLSDKGHEVTLFALAANKHNLNLDKATDTLKTYCKLSLHPIDTDVKGINAFFNLFSKKSYNTSRFYNKNIETELANILKSNSYDIIQAESTFSTVYTDCLLAHRKATPLILRQHNVESEIWYRRSAETSNIFKKWYLNLLAKRLKAFEVQSSNRYDHLITLTVDDQANFESQGVKTPITVMPLGFDFKPTPTGHKNRPVFFHIGSMQWTPNQQAMDWFINKVWPAVIQKFPMAEFHFAGLGLRRDLWHNPENNIYNHGEVESISDFTSDKDICIVPLRSGSGVRVKILECMADGKLVMSTTVGAQGISIHDGKEYIGFETVEEFLDGVTTIIGSPEKATTVANQGRDYILANYELGAVTDKTVAFYKSLTSSKIKA